MVIADTLSRACCIDTNTDRMEEELSCAIHMTVALYNTPTSDVRLQEVKEATKKDSTLQLLRQTVQSGWPRKGIQVPKEVQEYWNIRDEISETDGLIMKGERLVIPTDLIKDRDAETNTHRPHGNSKVFPVCQGTDVLARHV